MTKEERAFRLVDSTEEYLLDDKSLAIKDESPSSSRRRTLDDFLEAGLGGRFEVNHQWRYWCIMLSLGVANSSDATEILCISYMLGDAEFRQSVLGNGNSGVLAGAVFLGMLLGGLVVGTMGDWIGRKPMLLFGLVCNSVSGILSALAPNVYCLAALRCIAGVGIGATVPPLFTLATELAPPSARGFCVTICASFWMVGSVYVALVALWCFEHFESPKGIAIWRIFAVLCAAPSLLGAILVGWWVPESPRFLGLEGRSVEAVAIANDLMERMRVSNSVPPLTIDELDDTFPSSAVLDREGRLRSGGSFEVDRWQGSIGFLRLAGLDFVRSTSKLYEPNLKHTTWALQLVWFSLSFGTYGLLTWINILFEKVHLENIYFNALLFAASNLPGNLLTAFFMDKMRRSTSLVGSIALASISLGLFAMSAMMAFPLGIIASACFFQCFSVAAWNTIDTMTSELFPTVVRSTGLGICAASGRIGALLAQLVNDKLIEHPIRLLLVAAGTLSLGALTPYLLPGDMTGQPVNDDLQQPTTQQGTRPSRRWILEHAHDSGSCCSEDSSGNLMMSDNPSIRSTDSGMVRRSGTRQWYSWDDEDSD